MVVSRPGFPWSHCAIGSWSRGANAACAGNQPPAASRHPHFRRTPLFPSIFLGRATPTSSTGIRKRPGGRRTHHRSLSRAVERHILNTFYNSGPATRSIIKYVHHVFIFMTVQQVYRSGPCSRSLYIKDRATGLYIKDRATRSLYTQNPRTIAADHLHGETETECDRRHEPRRARSERQAPKVLTGEVASGRRRARQEASGVRFPRSAQTRRLYGFFGGVRQSSGVRRSRRVEKRCARRIFARSRRGTTAPMS